MPGCLCLCLVLAGLELELIDLGEEVLDVRVADIDADGVEDVVAVSEKNLYLLRGGRTPAVRRPAPPLTVVGHGLVGIVEDGRYRAVEDPFGAWTVGPPGASSLLSGLGANKPALLLSPGDADGDGRDDPLLVAPDGLQTPAGLLPLTPRADLAIKRNELFAVEYRIPVPAIGNWSGRGRELVLFVDDEIRSYRGLEQTDRILLKLPTHGRTPDSVRRNHVLFHDVDADGRMDMLVIFARGETGGGVRFETTVRYFAGTRTYDRKRQGFYRPATYLKVDGALLRADLLDLDSDGDLDLVLGMLDPGMVAAALGQAETHYYGFRFDKRTFVRIPVWRHSGSMALARLTNREPEPPARPLPDLDDDGRPELLVRHRGSVELLEATRKGKSFRSRASVDVKEPGAPAIGKTKAAVPHASGVVVARGTP